MYMIPQFMINFISIVIIILRTSFGGVRTDSLFSASPLDLEFSFRTMNFPPVRQQIQKGIVFVVEKKYIEASIFVFNKIL